MVIAKTLREEGKYNEQEIKLISGQLKHLFFRFDRNTIDKHTIIYRMFLERYLRYGLSIAEYMKENSRLRDCQHEKIHRSASYKNILAAVSTSIIQDKLTTKEAYELQVESLFCPGPKLKEQSERKYIDREAFTNLMWNYDSNLIKKYYRKEEEFGNFIILISSTAKCCIMLPMEG